MPQVYAILKLFGKDGFRTSVVAASNFGRDADTLGAIVGALTGAIYGREAIPQNWIEMTRRPRGVCLPFTVEDDIVETALKLAERFFKAYGLEHLLSDERFSNNEARVKNAEELDCIVAQKLGSLTLEENKKIIAENELTAEPVGTIQDIVNDPHWQYRQLLVDAPLEDGTVCMHSPIPKFSQTPGEIHWAGHELGADNEWAYLQLLGIDEHEYQRLCAGGMI